MPTQEEELRLIVNLIDNASAPAKKIADQVKEIGGEGMDDRRHRLYKLDQGDTAMFRGRGDKQQFHLTKDGGFWTAPKDKTVRMQLLTEDSESNATQQQGGGGSGGAGAGGGAAASTLDAAGGSGGQQSGGGQQQQSKKGQEAKYKDGKKSPYFVDVTKDSTRASGKEVHIMMCHSAARPRSMA